MRRAATPAEALLWRELRSGRFEGVKFRRQAPVDGRVVDFLCASQRITIELDGDGHDAARDASRRLIVERAGYVELRFSNLEVKERLDWVLGEIGRAIDAARAARMRDPAPRIG
ncbi:MAG: DUF559 domain-containing protein [Hyphomicrobiales bacterium]|nr:DUF559 domain-containing protein [Hyphomicrobiales bacterium]